MVRAVASRASDTSIYLLYNYCCRYPVEQFPLQPLAVTFLVDAPGKIPNDFYNCFNKTKIEISKALRTFQSIAVQHGYEI